MWKHQNDIATFTTFSIIILKLKNVAWFNRHSPWSESEVYDLSSDINNIYSDIELVKIWAWFSEKNWSNSLLLLEVSVGLDLNPANNRFLPLGIRSKTFSALNKDPSAARQIFVESCDFKVVSTIELTTANCLNSARSIWAVLDGDFWFWNRNSSFWTISIVEDYLVQTIKSSKLREIFVRFLNYKSISPNPAIWHHLTSKTARCSFRSWHFFHFQHYKKYITQKISRTTTSHLAEIVLRWKDIIVCDQI